MSESERQRYLDELISRFDVEDEQTEKDERHADACDPLQVRVAATNATNATPTATHIPVIEMIVRVHA